MKTLLTSYLKIILLVFLLSTLFLCCNKAKTTGEADKQQIDSTLNAWHNAAAKAEYETYFSYFSDTAVFIGTDAKENWQVNEFKTWSKPYFDRGKAWSFTTLSRHIYFDSNCNSIAWFDELLNTQMKICRGSGVMVKQNDKWKIKHYVLSMTIPNENIDSIVAIKSLIEDSVISQLQQP